MQIIKSGFEEIKTSSLYKKIEFAGRTCYKSENYITEDSAIDFTKRIMAYNHGSVLEHAYLVYEIENADLYNDIKKLNLPFVHLTNITKPIISFNFRAFYNLYLKKEDYPILHSLFAQVASQYKEVLDYDVSLKTFDYKEMSFLDVMKLTEEEKDAHLVVSIRFICDRGVSHELVRHRLASFAQESTRYCNYSKDKFSHEITFIETEGLDDVQREVWKTAVQNAELAYFKMLENGAKPEQARSVLPNSLKTEIVTTCSLKEWKIIFELRCALQAHPDIRVLMLKVRDYFYERGYLCR